MAHTRAIMACLLAAVLLPMAGVEDAAPADLIPAIELGYDRFAQSFRFTESTVLEDDSGGVLVSESFRDTTDVFTELRGQGELRFLDTSGAHRYDVFALGAAGSSLDRVLFNGWYRYRPPSGVTRWDAQLYLEGRHFKSDSEFSLSHDNRRAEARVQWRRRVSLPLDLGLKARVQSIQYEGRSDFEYDQIRWTLSGTAEIRNGFELRSNVELGGGTRSVPDSTQITYDRAFFRGDLYWNPAIGSHLSVFLNAERRVFHDELVRSPYWDLIFEPDFLFEFGPKWGMRFDAPQQILLFDRDGEVYQDTWIGRLGLGGFRRFGYWEIGVEPRFSWQVSPYDVDDEFTQPSVVFRVDLYGTGRLWLSLSEEIGRRHYEVPIEDEFNFYTDYTFFRTTLLATLRILENLSFDAFISDEPETHRRTEDYSRLSLFSFALRASL